MGMSTIGGPVRARSRLRWAPSQHLAHRRPRNSGAPPCSRARVGGITMIVSHAPSTNLAARMMASATPVATAPPPLIDSLARSPAAGPARSLGAAPMRGHAGLRQGEGEEGADGEERDQPVGDAAERDQQHARADREEQDARRIDQPPARRPRRRAAGSRRRATRRQRRGKPTKLVLADRQSTASTLADRHVVEPARARTTAATSCDSTLW